MHIELEQEELFTDIKNLEYKIQGSYSKIQNPFNNCDIEVLHEIHNSLLEDLSYIKEEVNNILIKSDRLFEKMYKKYEEYNEN